MAGAVVRPRGHRWLMPWYVAAFLPMRLTIAAVDYYIKHLGFTETHESRNRHMKAAPSLQTEIED